MRADPVRASSAGARWLLGLAAAGFVADALWRRSRAARLTVLPEPGAPGPAAAGTCRVAGTHHFVTAAGVTLDGRTRRAASEYATERGLDVLDLIPAGLDTAGALELVRRLDPGSFRASRLATGEGACHALLVGEEVLVRAGVERIEGLNAAEMDELTARLKRHAPVTTDVVVVPDLATVGRGAAERRAVLRRRWLHELPTYLTGNLGALAIFAAGAVLNPVWGALAVAAACAQPYLATAGTPLRPCDLHRFAWSRPLGAPYRLLRVAAAADRPAFPPAAAVSAAVTAAVTADPSTSRPASPPAVTLAGRPAALPALREWYATELAQGVDRFFEEPATACPWCGADDLRKVLTSRDYQQRKPGTFRLDRCRSCRHVFQNPRLSPEGLDFYYRDYYDGLGAAEVERGFRLGAPQYRLRARMLRGHAAPRNWLDVGGGHGHFCNAARDIWPRTRFDALDLGAGIEEAERQGWVDLAHRGRFPDLADKLAGTYDVVSMHHYLEHTTDPYAELDAAARVLPPGGHLLIEVPDPESPFARLAGRWWHNWFQPQHLHLIPLRNLRQALAERGLHTVAVERGAAHQELDLLMIVLLMLNRVVPDPDRPWLDGRHRRLRIAARTLGYAVAAPFLLTASATDQLITPVIRRVGGANTYRVLARRT